MAGSIAGWVMGRGKRRVGGSSASDGDDVQCAERVEQEDQAEDDANDFERLAFDEHAHNVIDDIEDESGDKQGDECGNHRNVTVVLAV